jgi:hypothetical protein
VRRDVAWNLDAPGLSGPVAGRGLGRMSTAAQHAFEVPGSPPGASTRSWRLGDRTQARPSRAL